MTDAPIPPPPKRPLLVRLAPLLILVAALAAAYALGLHRQFSFETLSERRAALEAYVAAHLALALLAYVAIYAAIVAVSLPVSMYLTIAGGFLFGFWIGGAAAWTGSVLGATLIFLAARTALGDILRRHAGPWLRRFEAGFRENAFNYLLALRFLPIMPFWVTNLAGAFFAMKLLDFVVATMIGIVPATLVYASVGNALRHALAAGASVDPAAAVRDLLLSPIVWGPIAGLIALSLLPVVVKKLRRRA